MSIVAELPKRSHGTTFGGNPLACAAALATIEYLETEDLPRRAADLGARFVAELREIRSSVVRDVRGLGLMVALELKGKSGPYLEALAQRGTLALSAGANVMRFLPPLVISEEDLDQVVRHVSEGVGGEA